MGRVTRRINWFKKGRGTSLDILGGYGTLGFAHLSFSRNPRISLEDRRFLRLGGTSQGAHSIADSGGLKRRGQGYVMGHVGKSIPEDRQKTVSGMFSADPP